MKKHLLLRPGRLIPRRVGCLMRHGVTTILSLLLVIICTHTRALMHLEVLLTRTRPTALRIGYSRCQPAVLLPPACLRFILTSQPVIEMKICTHVKKPDSQMRRVPRVYYKRKKWIQPEISYYAISCFVSDDCMCWYVWFMRSAKHSLSASTPQRGRKTHSSSAAGSK